MNRPVKALEEMLKLTDFIFYSLYYNAILSSVNPLDWK